MENVEKISVIIAPTEKDNFCIECGISFSSKENGYECPICGEEDSII